MSIHTFKGMEPNIGSHVYLSDSAHIIGRVTLGPDSSVFFNSVIRADINTIKIGAKSNVQDNCTFHVSDLYGVEVGVGCTIGHNAILHACSVGDNTTIGMGAIVMDGAEIGSDSIVAAGSLVAPGKKFESGMLILGNPAKAVRQLTKEEIDSKKIVATHSVP